MATSNPFTASQAPSQTMQMIAPDLATQQMQLSRQQQFAALLQQQALSPADPTQVINGWAVKQSPVAGISKIAQALIGGMIQKNSDQKQLDLSKALQGRMADILGGGGTSAPQPVNAAPGQLGSGMSDIGVDPAALQASGAPSIPIPAGQPPMPNSVTNPAPQPAQGVTPNNFNLANLLRGNVISSLGGDSAGSAYWKGMEPTDISRMGQQGGLTPDQIQAANVQGVAKANYLAPVQARAGSTMLDPRTGLPMFNAPHIPDGYTPTFGQDGKITGMNQIPGALNAIQASTQATAAGKAAVTPMAGVDADGNPVYTNALAASGGAPSASGAPVTNNTGPFVNYKAPGAPAGGIVTPAPRPGLISNADTAQKASAQTMQNSYAKLQSGNSSAQSALDAIGEMQQLGADKSVLSAGPLGTMATAINPSSAKYEKLRANLITQLANQNGTNGSDAGRALTGESVPDYGKPSSAIAEGLGMLKNQTIVQQMKTNFLSPVYQAGDSKKYTTLENQFDQNVAPSMVPLLTAQPGPARAALLQNAAKDPTMRSKLEWAVQNGLLK